MPENQIRESFTFISPVRLLWPNLDHPKMVMDRYNKPTGKMRFDAQLMFLYDHSQLADLQAAFGRVAMSKFGFADKELVQYPVKAGEAEVKKYIAKETAKGKTPRDRDYMLGHYLMSASSGDKFPPKLCLMEGGRVIDLTGDARALHADKFYHGVEALVQVNLSPYLPVREGDKHGVSCYLQMVCSLNKGTRLAGGASGSEVFSAYVGHVSDVDPSAGASVAIF